MGMRSSWTGTLGFGLVTIPVKLYTATSTADRGKMHQYHSADNGRVRMPKTCSVCGKELPSEEIVKGYETGKDSFVIITEDEMKTLPLPTAGGMSIVGFVEAESVVWDAWNDELYYISIDDKQKGAAKAFTLLNQVMAKLQVVGITKISFRDREHLAMVKARPDLGVLLLQTLHWAAEIKDPGELKVEGTVSDEEMKLGEMLVGNMRKPVDLESFVDEYNDALKKLVEAKMNGQVIEAPVAAKPTADTSLLDGLMASLGMPKS